MDESREVSATIALYISDIEVCARDMLAGDRLAVDPLSVIADLEELRAKIELCTQLSVDAARRDGITWSRIAGQLGISRQAVVKRYEWSKGNPRGHESDDQGGHDQERYDDWAPRARVRESGWDARRSYGSGHLLTEYPTRRSE